MLATLRIKNVALVADLTIEFPSGLVTITGETGAGKSIVIGALNLVLGERADRNLIRAGEESCSVEAVFQIGRLREHIEAFLEANGIEPCEGNQLLLKRAFTAAGSNRQFINGTPATLNLLARLGEWLVDLHGPHDHQSLLHPARQLAILDAFGNLEPPRAAFAELVRQRLAILERKTALVMDEKTYMQQLDLLRFQVNEIKAAALHPGEDDEVGQAYNRASNAARLLQLSQAAAASLGGDEDSAVARLGTVGRLLQELRRLEPLAGNLIEQHRQAATAFRELQDSLSHYTDTIEVDPARLHALEERLNLLQALKRKYGQTIEEVLAFGEQTRERLRALEQRDEELGRLNAELARLDVGIWSAGADLSARRRQVIPRLTQAVDKQLRDLGFGRSSFEISLSAVARQPSEAGRQTTSAQFSPTGLDTVEFQFTPNPGEPARPLRAIASSGELARVMLALKAVLAAEDEVPVLVFDEVDANVGGQTAVAVADKMRQIARNRQVFCITHLAPVAAAASAHFMVSKNVSGGRTLSSIDLLDKKDRVTELARMLGGQSDAALKHAAALLEP